MTGSMLGRALAFAAAVAICVASARPANAQAWVPARGTGVTTLDYQMTKVNYHLFSQDMSAYGGTGNGVDLGKIDGQSIQLGLDYGIARNLGFSASIAYVGATYQGDQPEDIMDDATFNGTLQDASFGVRYMVPWKGFAISPNLGFGFPTHDYATHGHTAVGKGNSSFNIGIAAGRTLMPWASNVWLQGGYTHEFVEDVEQWGLDVNEFSASAGWFPRARLGVTGYFTYHDTNDGVDWYWSDFAAPGVEENHDAAAKALYRRVGGAVSYQLNATTGLFVDIGGIVSGSNTHDGVSYNVGTSWSFLGPAIH
jgi:hypothetical protein